MPHPAPPTRARARAYTRARTATPAPLAALMLLAAAACAPSTTPSTVPTPAAPALPLERVIDTRRAADVSWDAMLDDLATADAVFLGEQHDDSSTHRLELAVLEGLDTRRVHPVLALEMFERDVQPLLDRYLRDELTEEQFLAGSRPWPNYATDYRPMVELARVHEWPVVASNVPRPIAAAVSRGGLGVLDTMSAERRALVAAQISCPDDDYRRKFIAQMGEMGGHGGSDEAAARAMLERFYQAQCIKDETMGESVAAAIAPARVLVHVNGAFHSDERLGTVSRVLRRSPATRALVVSFVPAPLAATLTPAELAAKGDYVVITYRSPD